MDVGDPVRTWEVEEPDATPAVPEPEREPERVPEREREEVPA